MRLPDADGPPPADDPLDEFDRAILRGIRDMFSAADPMPADLPERIRFSLALRDLEVEVARLAVDGEPAGVRGEERSRTVTFDSDSMTIMIRIGQNSDETIRLDGWLAPAQSCPVEIRTGTGALIVTADERGRFAFSRVPRGSAQLIVRPVNYGPDRPPRTVVTPAIVL